VRHDARLAGDELQVAGGPRRSRRAVDFRKAPGDRLDFRVAGQCVAQRDARIVATSRSSIRSSLPSPRIEAQLVYRKPGAERRQRRNANVTRPSAMP
jgi:hypothetical protein